MRRAIPQPCCDPRTSSVLRTISASVPCKTSGFSFMMNQPLGFQQEYYMLPFGKQQETSEFFLAINPEGLVADLDQGDYFKSLSRADGWREVLGVSYLCGEGDGRGG